MRRLLYLSLITIITLNSCSKKSSDPQPTNTVSISGSNYSTVVIGNQTWTSVNYNGPGGTINTSLNEAIYGKYYTIAEMQAISLPTGWRVPTEADFVTLLKSQGNVTQQSDGTIELASLVSKNLRALSNWDVNGDNSSGFNAEPAGFCYASGPVFEYLQGTAYFLSSTPSTSSFGGNIALMVVGSIIPLGITEQASIDPHYGFINASFTLRFVKDN